MYYKKGTDRNADAICYDKCTTEGATRKSCDTYVNGSYAESGVCIKVENDLVEIVESKKCTNGCSNEGTECAKGSTISCTFGNSSIEVDDYVCDANKLMKCDPTGNLVQQEDCGTNKTCDAQNKSCIPNGSAYETCSFNGSTIKYMGLVCDGNKLMICYGSEGLELYEDCSESNKNCDPEAKTCVPNKCTLSNGTINAGEYYCDGNNLMVCTNEGNLELEKECGGRVCSAQTGSCKANCQDAFEFKDLGMDNYAHNYSPWDTNDDGCISAEEAAAVTEIPNGALVSNCKMPNTWYIYSLEDLNNFPNLTKIGDNAFANCAIRRTLYLSNVKTIGKQAFYNCESIYSIDLPAATTIGEEAFKNNKILTTVSIPNATEISDSAFENDLKLMSFTAPNLTKVGKRAFYGSFDINNYLEITLDLPKANNFGEEALYFACIGTLKLTTSDNIVFQTRSFLTWPAGDNGTLMLHSNKKPGVTGSPNVQEYSNGKKYWGDSQWKEILYTD